MRCDVMVTEFEPVILSACTVVMAVLTPGIIECTAERV
jgi:hypothetical protein